MKASSDPNHTLPRRVMRFVKGHVLGDSAAREAARRSSDCGNKTLRLQYRLTAAEVVLDCGGFQGDWAAAVHARYGWETDAQSRNHEFNWESWCRR